MHKKRKTRSAVTEFHMTELKRRQRVDKYIRYISMSLFSWIIIMTWYIIFFYLYKLFNDYKYQKCMKLKFKRQIQIIRILIILFSVSQYRLYIYIYIYIFNCHHCNLLIDYKGHNHKCNIYCLKYHHPRIS